MLLLHVVDDRAETETPPSQNVYRQSRSLQVRTSLQRRLLSPSCIAPPCHSALFACHRGIALDGSQRSSTWCTKDDGQMSAPSFFPSLLALPVQAHDLAMACQIKTMREGRQQDDGSIYPPQHTGSMYDKTFRNHRMEKGGEKKKDRILLFIFESAGEYRMGVE